MPTETIEYSFIQLSDYPLIDDAEILLLLEKESSISYGSFEEVIEILKRDYAAKTNPDKTIQKILRNKGIEIIFIISCEGLFFERNRSAFEGVKLLKWMRLKGINNHCVMTSFLPFRPLVQNANDKLILASRGVSFFRLGGDWDTFKKEFDKTTKADKENLKSVFRSEIDLKTIRHDEANIYGLNKLKEHHLKIEPAAIFMNSSSKDDLSHELCRYVFEDESTNIIIGNNIFERLRELRAINTTVIYIDDMIDQGWGDFLKVLLGTNSKIIEIKPESNDTAISLVGKIETELTKENITLFQVDLYISDLKLFKSEKSITDYSKLISYEVVKELRKKRDDRFKVMYLTASNDLSKLRTLLKYKDYNPQIIFTKEGPDQLLSSQESFEKYADLVHSLHRVLRKDMAKRAVENLQLLNLIEEQRKIDLSNALSHFTTNINTLRTFDHLKKFDSIYIDTNIFLKAGQASDTIELFINEREKIKILASVKYELDCIAEDVEERKPIESISAMFFKKLIEELNIQIDNTQLTDREAEIINNKEQYPKDFADNQFKRLLSSKGKDTLLICDDRGILEYLKLTNPSVCCYRNILGGKKAIRNLVMSNDTAVKNNTNSSNNEEEGEKKNMQTQTVERNLIQFIILKSFKVSDLLELSLQSPFDSKETLSTIVDLRLFKNKDLQKVDFSLLIGKDFPVLQKNGTQVIRNNVAVCDYDLFEKLITSIHVPSPKI